MIKTDKKTRTIWAYGEVEEHGDFSAAKILEHLAVLGDGPFTVRMNTDGGSVIEGVAIYNALKRHNGEVTTINDSVCASMGSVIFLAGDIRLATTYCSFMIHSPHTASTGNKKELRKSADTLDHFENVTIEALQSCLNVSKSEIETMVENETWFNANEAVEIGLATGVEQITAEATELVKASTIKPPTVKFLRDKKIAAIHGRIKHGRESLRESALARHRQVLAKRFAKYQPGLPDLNRARSIAALAEQSRVTQATVDIEGEEVSTPSTQEQKPEPTRAQVEARRAKMRAKMRAKQDPSTWPIAEQIAAANSELAKLRKQEKLVALQDEVAVVAARLQAEKQRKYDDKMAAMVEKIRAEREAQYDAQYTAQYDAALSKRYASL